MKKGLILGRFQPFHLGHLSVIQEILNDQMQPIICIGSAQEGNTKNNPFTTEERKTMIKTVMNNLGCDYEMYEITDIHNNDKYVSYLEKLVPEFDAIYSGNLLVQRLFKAAGYRVVEPKVINREIWEGAAIRQAMTEDDDWETAVPSQIVDLIHDLNGIEKLQNLA